MCGQFDLAGMLHRSIPLCLDSNADRGLNGLINSRIYATTMEQTNGKNSITAEGQLKQTIRLTHTTINSSSPFHARHRKKKSTREATGHEIKDGNNAHRKIFNYLRQELILLNIRHCCRHLRSNDERRTKCS